jgi:flagellar basal-body rod protein FlgC
MPNFTIPESALSSLDVVMQNSAHAIANVNTDGFRASRVVLESGPVDEGVRVGAVYRDMRPGPAVITHLTENDVRVANDIAARGMRTTQENFDTAVAQDVDRLQQANAADAWRVERHREGQYSANLIHGMVEGSNTDIPREFTTLLMTENAYGANAAVIRALDELTGSLVNVKV